MEVLMQHMATKHFHHYRFCNMMELHGEKLYWKVFQPEVQKSVEKHFLGFGMNKNNHID